MKNPCSHPMGSSIFCICKKKKNNNIFAHFSFLQINQSFHIIHLATVGAPWITSDKNCDHRFRVSSCTLKPAGKLQSTQSNMGGVYLGVSFRQHQHLPQLFGCQILNIYGLTLGLKTCSSSSSHSLSPSALQPMQWEESHLQQRRNVVVLLILLLLSLELSELLLVFLILPRHPFTGGNTSNFFFNSIWIVTD